MAGYRARMPARPTVVSDDGFMRVTQWDFAPGAETGHHVHGLSYIVVPMTDCRFRIEDGGGAREFDVAKGAVYRREAGVEHNVVNAGDAPMCFIEIELK
ncbi:cupin [Rhizobium sp. Leaf371]|uniref:cupin domain-containing protein n=1 Tax=Rhizobium sp. Leaf371 TaxID=1736355 RepID=UPI0007158DC7|nr:cupin domain-containing protein [Rhizobium sp. Leaf371]KQS67853.1 cupin [Rhizobium sp. Leaf371]